MILDTGETLRDFLQIMPIPPQPWVRELTNSHSSEYPKPVKSGCMLDRLWMLYGHNQCSDNIIISEPFSMRWCMYGMACCRPRQLKVEMVIWSKGEGSDVADE